MIPVPGFYHYPARSKQLSLYQIPYFLDEDNDWALDVCELKRALDKSRLHCRPRGLVVINPEIPQVSCNLVGLCVCVSGEEGWGA